MSVKANEMAKQAQELAAIQTQKARAAAAERSRASSSSSSSYSWPSRTISSERVRVHVDPLVGSGV